MISHVAFDFDGTLVRSNQIKRACFYEVAAALPGAAETLDGLFARHPEMDRHGMFRALLETLPAPVAATASADRLVAEYGRLCRRRIAGAEEVPGAARALAMLKALGVRLYLISATPQGPLEDSVGDRGLTGMFDRVLGGPTGKTAHLRGILSDQAIGPADIVMIGDGRDDQAAAANIGCRFIAVTDQPKDVLRDVEQSVADLRGLPEVLGLNSPAASAAGTGGRL